MTRTNAPLGRPTCNSLNPTSIRCPSTLPQRVHSVESRPISARQDASQQPARTTRSSRQRRSAPTFQCLLVTPAISRTSAISTSERFRIATTPDGIPERRNSIAVDEVAPARTAAGAPHSARSSASCCPRPAARQDEAIRRLLVGIDRADPLAVSDALLEIVPRPEAVADAELGRDLGRFLARHVVGGAADHVAGQESAEVAFQLGVVDLLGPRHDLQEGVGDRQWVGPVDADQQWSDGLILTRRRPRTAARGGARRVGSSSGGSRGRDLVNSNTVAALGYSVRSGLDAESLGGRDRGCSRNRWGYT